MNEKNKINQEIIDQHEIIISTALNRIKTKLKEYLQKEIKDVKSKLGNYSDRQNKLNTELNKLGTELLILNS